MGGKPRPKKMTEYNHRLVIGDCIEGAANVALSLVPNSDKRFNMSLDMLELLQYSIEQAHSEERFIDDAMLILIGGSIRQPLIRDEKARCARCIKRMRKRLDEFEETL